MTERVVIGNAELWHGDAREVLPLLPGVDAVITDPVWPNCPLGVLRGADGSQDALMGEALRAIEAERVVIVMGFDSDPRFLDAVPRRWPFIRSQQLPYAFPGYRGRLLAGDEMAYVFGTIPHGRGVIPGRAKTKTDAKDRTIGHPCPRQVVHMLDLVGWWSRGTVLDPFMGAGTTGVAATMLGRPFIGVEIEREYFDIACRRISRAQAQGTLLPPEPPAKQEQGALL